jgi:alginate O-acetyltransferase complex protein AlgI
VLFNSTEFLIFFLVVFGLYWAAPSRKLKILLLLAASYYFYMSWNKELALVVACSSMADFFIGIAMEKSESARRRKRLMQLSIMMNVGLLFYFKYTNFFLDSLHSLLERLGVHRTMPMLDVILPIGISFYTFEAISYMVDVYHGRTKAEKDPINFLLFITFFPRMVAGPIIRARNFLPQLGREKRFDVARFDLGLQYVLMGLFKKMAIADRMGWLVDPVYAYPARYTTGAVWIAVIAYSLQVYCDFSGYSDIAIGTAHMLGFKLPVNFDMPYMSRNISEFWRRWHISLSTWLRDYVFISMGGSRGTELKTAFTLMVTMVLCGLWHGANWTFVSFGVAQGLMLLVQRGFRLFCKARPRWKAFMETGGATVWSILFTYWMFVLSLVLFRGPDFSKIAAIYRALFVPQHGVMVRDPVGPMSLAFTFTMVAIAHVTVESGLWKKMSARFSPPVWGLIYLLIVGAICMLVTPSVNKFIYFQF